MPQSEHDFEVDRMGIQLGVEGSVLAEAIIRDRQDALVQEATTEDGLTEDNAAFLYLNEAVAGTRYRMLKMMEDSDHTVEHLIQAFKGQPVLFQAYCRNNILRLATDPRLTKKERKEQVNDYIDAYIDMVIQLDHATHPVNDEVQSGIPEYIPDGLSDMGSDDSLGIRSRERIRVRKSHLYTQYREFIDKVLSNIMRPEGIITQAAQYIHAARKYELNPARRVIPAERYMTVALDAMNDKNVGVCRQDALNFQVLMQLLGFESRLLKCTLSMHGRAPGNHAANLVKIGNDWYLIDVTNKCASGNVFIQKIPEQNIDLNNEEYIWEFHDKFDIKRIYRSRNNMYYRIRDNAAPLNGDGNEIASDAITEPGDLYNPFPSTLDAILNEEDEEMPGGKIPFLHDVIPTGEERTSSGANIGPEDADEKIA